MAATNQNVDNDFSVLDFYEEKNTMDTSLCIIPPDEAWDSIQRARHHARDPSIYQWPPAIRLFHPFTPRSDIPNAAISIAQFIEENDLEGFDVTLDQLLIVPHFEVIDQMKDSQRILPKQDAEQTESSTIAKRQNIQSKAGSKSKKGDENRNEAMTHEEVQALIDSEERKGRQKLKRRLQKKHKDAQPTMQAIEKVNDDSNDTSSRDLSPKELFEKQKKQQKTEFNGPCVICLEPDEESRIQIEAFREVLRKNLFPNHSPFSVSSALTPSTNTKNRGKRNRGTTASLPRMVLKKHGLLPNSSGMKDNSSTFRPVLTLGRFSTVTKAVKVARELQQTWEPLTFHVSDLHFVSRVDMQYDESDNILSSVGEYGCDALVMLNGLELDLSQMSNEFDAVDRDDEMSEDEILDLLMSEAGTDGGHKASSSPQDASVNDEDNESVVDLEEWLHDDSDDNDDEGATVIIGRTQFFTGEMRQYVGMPASSAMDGKDRVLGDGVSGSARRRGVIHRQGNRWNEGDFGQKDKDYLP